ncbi:Protein of unknown function [Singulisphaera sp. GP187]|uniref:c-type heme family protein n=1 Tax=Singulisphaera sp. GP187 TaxID=1882752 RepID=UPI00092A8CDC|nr:DUF3365 domain-containing protein [Singulisphaera sp. GP187]SIO65575.1 Protein of unknown function [Singulisphaera sp. GP187]
MQKGMKSGRLYCVVCLVASLAAAALVAVLVSGTNLRADEAGKDPAVTRARDQVKMLDSLYKTAVVSVTKRYDEGPPAIKVAMDVFGAMDKEGWHKAKLVDASGAPQNEANLPKTDFEKRAAKAMQAGKPYYEEIAGQGEKRTLYAATIVPAVLKRCASCHGAKEGELLGFIRYEVPVK